MKAQLGKKNYGQCSRSHVENLRYHWKALVIRNTHAKYESPISYGKKVIHNIKVY